MVITNTQYYVFLTTASMLFNFSSSYKFMNLDDQKLCSPVTNRKIRLESETSSALVVSLGRLKDHPYSWEKNFLCTFKVQVQSPNVGLFVVIQKIVFRKNVTSEECIDYVEYKRSDRLRSKKFCGRFNAALGMDRIFASDAYATTSSPTLNSFLDPMGILDVTIYISREALKTHEEMDLEIVFTAFSLCQPNAYEENLQCRPKHFECIFKEFFNDGYVNCPYPDCVDEDGCSEKLEESVGNKVVIGSVTSLFLMFVIFICCIWLCRKYKKLCWADSFATSNNANLNLRNTARPESNAQDVSIPSTTRVVVTSTATNAVSEGDKDLPPSYESLFPNG